MTSARGTAQEGRRDHCNVGVLVDEIAYVAHLGLELRSPYFSYSRIHRGREVRESSVEGVCGSTGGRSRRLRQGTYGRSEAGCVRLLDPAYRHGVYPSCPRTRIRSPR